jgi:hypothetical protein
VRIKQTLLENYPVWVEGNNSVLIIQRKERVDAGGRYPAVEPVPGDMRYDVARIVAGAATVRSAEARGYLTLNLATLTNVVFQDPGAGGCVAGSLDALAARRRAVRRLYRGTCGSEGDAARYALASTTVPYSGTSARTGKVCSRLAAPMNRATIGLTIMIFSSDT